MSVKSTSSQNRSRDVLGAVLGRIPSGLFILTAACEDRRAGMLVSFVQQICFEPPTIALAIGKGRAIMPLISESRRFGLCQLAKDDRLTMRKFSRPSELGEDPFLGFELAPSTLPDVPLVASAMSVMECELACHMDVEGDHDLFVGRVLHAAMLAEETEPHIHLRKNGLNY